MDVHYNSRINNTHCIGMAVDDLSFWCHSCDSYLNHLTIQPIFEVYKAAYIIKFGESVPEEVLQRTKFLDLNNGENQD